MIKESIYKTYNFYLDTYKKHCLFKLFPEFIEINTSYEELNSINNQISFTSYIFEQGITTGVYDDMYFVQWDNEKVKSIIEKYKLPIQNINLNALYSDRNNLDFNKVKDYKEKYKIIDPIFVAYYLPINAYLVIDGNHRYEVNKLRNLNTIDAIILPPFAHHEAMANDLSKSLYKLHHNLQILGQFCNTPKDWKISINKSLEFQTFYSERFDRNLKFQSLRKKIMKLIS